VTTIRLPFDQSYDQTYLGEFEWEMTFRQDLIDWLEEHASGAYWIEMESKEFYGSEINIEDPAIALLFKLTWGGI
jgi:hypothetical protein